MTEGNMSFDRMRGILTRAAEIRDREQKEIFDSLSEIHSRLAMLDALGAVRKRLTELPDRNEVNVLAERVDETVTRLEMQESAITATGRSVDGIVDRLAKPFAQLDGRLDTVATRMEGVSSRMEGAITTTARSVDTIVERLAKPFAQLDGRLDAVTGRMEVVSGRMEGLDERLGGLHKRLDDLDNRMDRNERRIDGLPSALSAAVRERVEGLERSLCEQLNSTQGAVQQSLTETGEGVRHLVGETTVSLQGRLGELLARPAVNPTEQLAALADRLESLAARLDGVGVRLDSVENGLASRMTHLGGTVEEGIEHLESALQERPDRNGIATVVQQVNEESERRSASHLNDAMVTFAELIVGSGATGIQPMFPPPRPAERRGRSKPAVKAVNGRRAASDPMDDADLV